MRRKIIAVVVLLCVLAVGCAIAIGPLLLYNPPHERGAPIDGLIDPEKLVLYSIDGAADSETAYDRAIKDGKETLGRYAVLGKLQINDPGVRRKLVSVLQDSVINHDGIVAECFLPRHAIVAKEKGRDFEIVICFECRSYTMNEGHGGGLISRRGQAHFNELLQEAGIPIAP